MCYNKYMKNIYRHTDTTVSLINYQFIFYPLSRKSIFLIPNLEERFKALVEERCKELNIKVINIKCKNDYIHMILNCLPTQTPNEVMYEIKNYTNKFLKKEFKQLSEIENLWNENYLVSSLEDISIKIIQKYIEDQKLMLRNANSKKI